MKHLGSNVDYFLRRAAPRATHAITLHWGELLGQWNVCEFPKSGGTWVSRMLGDYLGIPFPQNARLPIAMPAVLHSHWRYDQRLQRVVYVYRDGRDVMVSLYFHQLHLSLRKQRRVIALSDETEGIRALMPVFLERELRRPFSSPLPWQDHVSEWLGHNGGTVPISYESLLDGAFEVMCGVLKRFDVMVDEARLTETVDRESFRRQARRAPGEEDRSAFLRKGIVGDWHNYFTPEAAEVFEFHAGPMLRQLGYENDAAWVSECLPAS